MWGAIAGAATGLASGVIGAINAGKAQRKADKLLTDESNRVDNQFNNEYYANALDRSRNQSLLNNVRQLTDRNRKSADNTAAVTGATQEAKLASKAAASNVISNAAGQISASNDNYKTNVLARYNNLKSSLVNRQVAGQNAKAQGWSNLMGSGLSTVGAALPSFAGTPKKV